MWTDLDERNVKEGGQILLSFRTQTAKEIKFPPYKGSKQLPCQRCNNLMLVGPAQQEKRDEGIYSLCETCLIEIHGQKAVTESMVALTDKKAGE